MATKECSKCSGEMEKGKIYPKHLKTPIMFGKPPKERKGLLTHAPRDKKEIVAYGCKKCGYMEFFIEELIQHKAE